MSASAEQIVRDACRVIWCEGATERMGEFYAEDFRADYPTTDWGEGLSGATALAAGIREAFPDYREQIDELIVADDEVVVMLTIRGTHTGAFAGYAATGRSFEFRDVSLIRVQGGKIVRQRGLSDSFSMFRQLGLLSLAAPDVG